MDGLITTLNRIVIASSQAVRDTGREPSPEELAEKLAIPAEEVVEVLATVKRMFTVEIPPRA